MKILPLLALAATLYAGQMAPLQANDELSGKDSDIKGMLVFKFPIGVNGGPAAAPRVGVDLRVENYRDYGSQQDRHDPKTGARLSNGSLEKVRTWNWDSLDSVDTEQEAHDSRKIPDFLDNDPS
ncbi:MAG: hypothetical protein AAF530_12820 [Pseudomonadota bacterium]